MHRLILLALYTALTLTANSALAGGVDREKLAEMRSGDMRKLILMETPGAPVTLTYLTKDGAEEALADSNGKIRIVNFWATWCAPCRQEKPALDALEAALGGADFEVIALATGRNSLDGIARFNAEVGVEHLKTRLDPKSLGARQFGVMGLPVSVILDREGREIGRLIGGADWNADSAHEIMRYLIGVGS
ncbi:MAG: TlpA disulfide reductase family protein [Pseudomonadota bacterium]